MSNEQQTTMIQQQANQPSQQQMDEFDIDQREIRELIWNSKIPVKIVLDNLCIASDDPPLPLYTFFRRVQHPVFYFKDIHEFFLKSAPIPLDEHDIWLEWGNKPIPWNLPFGLTFDLFNRDDDSAVSQQNKSNFDHNSSRSIDDVSIGDESDGLLPSSLSPLPFYPIPLTLHYGRQPAHSELLPIDKSKELHEVAQSAFKFSLKESLLIRNSSAFVLTQVSLQEQEQFLNALIKSDFDSFFPVLDVIFSNKTQLNNNHLVKLPLRIYIRDYPGRIQLQETILTGKETLGDLLCKYFPKILKNSENSFAIASQKYKNLRVICNGISCDFTMPLLYFYKHFFHYDGFTYLCIQF